MAKAGAAHGGLCNQKAAQILACGGGSAISRNQRRGCYHQLSEMLNQENEMVIF